MGPNGEKSGDRVERRQDHEYASDQAPDALDRASRMAQNAPPRWDRALRERLVDGEAAALGEAYDRFASLVHGLAHRVLADDTGADRITGEVFARLWEHPEDYDPGRGPLRSWLADLTHRLAAGRLRDARPDPPARGTTDPGRAGDVEHTVRSASVAARADHLVTSMPPPLRAALDLTYFQRRDFRQTASDLGITEAETLQRLRLGLRLVATAHGTGSTGPAPGPVTDSAAPHAPPGHGHGRPT